ncbi:MAG: bifunctional isocitrate dehydrogenase kinase/phosphatase [Verrucomicrobia bacterium]|nr:bifunctional isocitrate dehydrogenase kinase/phosphatase [Verrucomicrobiota bacterium]
MTDSRLATLCAEAIFRAAQAYFAGFQACTQRAPHRFLAADWSGAQQDAAARLRLYGESLAAVTAEIRQLLGARLRDRDLWAAMKAVFSSLIARCQEWEIAESFFNSVTRRIFTTVGVDARIEFLDTDFDSPPTPADPVHRRVEGADLPELILAGLAAAGFSAERCAPDLTAGVQEAARRIDAALAPRSAVALELVQSVFYRGKGAYVVGRALTVFGAFVSVAFCLRHGRSGLRLDALLLGDTALGVLFSFTRSHFLVEAVRPHALVGFLHVLLPRKPRSEFYTSIGHHKHGKTEFYRDLVRHLRHSTDRFQRAAGTRGMVMIVFTLPSLDVVFKLIRDQFDYPKDSTRRDVIAKYRLVFEHDRAGRLIDAHEFEQIRIETARFEPGLLEELRTQATHSVRFEGDHVVLQHAYVERRVRPLNLVLAQADPTEARAASEDYGRCILDLAAMNIFTGDLLPKNFGVTRSGRVVFYDYDELCWVTDCNFRDLPEPQTPEQEMAAEPWYTVRDNDIFPEEFPRFLRLTPEQLGWLQAANPGLFEASAWRALQERMRRSEQVEVLPYETDARIPET